MFRRTHYLLLLITALWLPLQSLTAFVMPLAWLAGSGTVQAAGMATDDALPCHEHGAAGADTADNTAGTDQGSCHRCAVCHLASSGFIPAAVLLVDDTPVSRAVNPLPFRRHDSQFPEPPDHPPRQPS